MNNVISEETINLAREVFKENRVGNSIFTTNTLKDYECIDNLFMKFDLNELSKSDKLLVRFFKETQPQLFETYQKQKANKIVSATNTNSEELNRLLISIQDTQKFLTQKLKKEEDNEEDKVDLLFCIGILFAGFAAFFYFAPIVAALLVTFTPGPFLFAASMAYCNDKDLLGFSIFLGVVGCSTYLAFLFPKLFEALVASHGMASFVLAGISAFLLVCGLLSKLNITYNKNQFFEKEIAPSLKLVASEHKQNENTIQASGGDESTLSCIRPLA